MGIFHSGSLAVVLMTGGLSAKEQPKTSEAFQLIAEDWRVEVGEIDKEIDKLTNQRNLYLAKATRLQNQGDRLQFESNNLIDARRAWQQAQIHREIATRIQEEIDGLEKRKQQILQSQGSNGQDKRKETSSKQDSSSY